MRRSKTPDNINLPQRIGKQPLAYDDFLSITRPLVTWYRFTSTDQIKQLPIQVVNALDSLSMMHGRHRQ